MEDITSNENREPAACSGPVEPLVSCRIALTLILDAGPVLIERVVRLPFVPRTGDWLWDSDHPESSCWSDEGIQIDRVGVCVSTGEVLLECGHETYTGETVDDLLSSWFCGFTVVS